MDEERTEIYGAGILCLIIFGVFAVFAYGKEWNTSTQTLWVISSPFGVLGIGSILFPDKFGKLAINFLKKYK